MRVRIRATGQVMYESEFRNYLKQQGSGAWRNQVITEAVMNEFGADPVFEGPQATGGTVYQYSQYDGVQKEYDGKWYTKYILGPVFNDYTDENGVFRSAADQETEYKASKDAEQAASMRSERDQLLAKTDWVTIKAVDASIDGLGIQLPQQWMDYRKALRDVPTQAGFPWNVVWPNKP